MPLKFACEHCGQGLSVSSSKIGRRAKCPKCQEPLTVPTREKAAETLANRRSGDASDETDENPFAQFVVYDDTELVYETDSAGRGGGRDKIPLDKSKVAVSRGVLYAQGVLLGVVAVSFFLFGILVGSRNVSTPATSADPTVCLVTGTVKYQGRPESGAVVICLPKDSKPDDRPRPDGLRPDEMPPPGDTNAGYRAIVENGGAYARTDANGEFSLRVKNSRYYFVLILSRTATRPPDDDLNPSQRSELASYFTSVDELIGRKQFRLRSIRVDGSHTELKETTFD